MLKPFFFQKKLFFQVIVPETKSTFSEGGLSTPSIFFIVPWAVLKVP
jgi:hypothetical protein